MSDPTTSLLHGDREMFPCTNISDWPPPSDHIFEKEPRKAISLTSAGRLSPAECIEIFEAISTRHDIDTLELGYKCLRSKQVKKALTRLLQQDRRWRVFFKLHGRTHDLEMISHLHPVRHLVLTQCPNLKDDYFEQLFSELRTFPNLRVFKLHMWSRCPAQLSLQHTQVEEDRDSIPSLFSWLSSSSCQLSDFTFVATFAHSVGFYQRLFAAIGQNQSIRKLELLALNSQLNIPEDLCPHLATSSIDTVSLKFSWFEWRYKFDSITVLSSWMIQSRSKRLLTVQFPKARWPHRFKRAEYISSIHKRWRRGQSVNGCMSFLADIPPCLWSMELERMSERWKDNNVESWHGLRSLALDTSFFLLKLWLSGISQVPDRPPVRQKRCCGSLQEYFSDGEDDLEEESGVVRLWGKKFQKIN